MNKLRLRIPGIFLFSVLSAIGFRTPFALADAEAKVWVVLGIHGSAQAAPQLLQHYADEFSKTIDEALRKSAPDQGQSIALWFENATPPSLFYSLSEPRKFFSEMETQTGIPVIEFESMLLEPQRFNPQDARKVTDVLKGVFEAHESRFKEEGKGRLRPRAFGRWLQQLEKTRKIETLYENFSFESWLMSLQSVAWETRMFEEVLSGDVEAALYSKLHKGVAESLSNTFRDKKLAEDIAQYQKEHPEALSIVIRGAAHDRLAQDLKKLGVKTKSLYQTDPELAGAFSDFWSKYVSRQDLFDKGFKLSQEDKAALTQELVHELDWKYLLANEPEIFMDDSRMLMMKMAVEALGPRALEEWRSLIESKAGDLTQQAEASWLWLLEKEPRLQGAADNKK